MMNNERLMRPKISIYIATSIDGYIARKDGSLDWLDRVGGFDDDYGFQNLVNSIDAVILGRKTYETAASAPEAEWPYNGKRVIVLSSSLQSVKRGVELFCGDVAQLVSQLHSDGIKHVWIDGGVAISQFLDAQMVDQMTVSVIPILLGSGVPLFNAIGKELPCRLVSSQSYPSGLVQLRYDLDPKEVSIKNYTLIQRPAIRIVGIECRTSNAPEAASHDIPQLWGRFYGENVLDRIPNKVSSDVIALYCDYEGDYTQGYSCVIGCPVSSLDSIPEGMVAKALPATAYAVFRAIGEHPKTLIETWGQIWQTKLERTYTGDYEVYGAKFSNQPQEVEVYVAVQ